MLETDEGAPPNSSSINTPTNISILDNATKTEKEAPRTPLESLPPPVLPRAPTNCFPREIMNEILDLTDQVASIALYGSIGVGKSFVALTILHDNRTKAIFGRNRHFTCYDDPPNSLEGFIERLCDAIGTNRTTDIGQLRSHLESSPPCLLVLDGVDSILDPLTPRAKEISVIIEKLGSDQRVCLVTTSRICPDLQGFHRIEVQTLPEDSVRETFYSHCGLDRSPAVDDLIAGLDFHPLSIDLLARSVREDGWDTTMLMQAWEDDQKSTLRTKHRQSLKDTLELSLCSPTIKNLGTRAQGVLNGIAASPPGVEEGKLASIFPYITEVEVVVDVLCRFSLIYRQDGFVKMLSPFRSYFLDSMVTLAQHEEVIHWGPDRSHAPSRTSFSLHPFCDHSVTAFESPPIFVVVPPGIQPPRTTKSATSPPNVNARRNLRPKRREHGDLCSLRIPLMLIDLKGYLPSCAFAKDPSSSMIYKRSPRTRGLLPLFHRVHLRWWKRIV